jgi:hypothetical protein
MTTTGASMLNDWMRMRTAQCVLVLLCSFCSQAFAETDFSTVESAALDQGLTAEGWQLLQKRGVPATLFSQPEPGVVLIQSDASNALIYRAVEPHESASQPVLIWSWRVDEIEASENLVAGVQPDWPVAVYAAFAVDKAYVSWWRRFVNRIKFNAIGLPDSGKILTYVWQAGPAESTADPVYPNPYLPNTGMILDLQSGSASAGWRSERRDLFADFAEAFGHPAESLIYLAISADSEDTGRSSSARLRHLNIE